MIFISKVKYLLALKLHQRVWSRFYFEDEA
jgi:hypothetical protein